ncbi:MAG TPA: hypothetical protein VNA69_04180 [Thermoanaerobaculia bacterium]|nr:hypothetical protein [Thermoanaerobaculia bacterium]
MSPVVITIFFVGIAAFVNVPPGSDVERMVIFPTALVGQYQGVQLSPHSTFLYLPGAALVATDKAAACTGEYKGTWNPATSLCTIALTGALVWTRTSEALTETPSFRKIPSFGALCPDAVDLPAKYTDPAMIAPEVVAAHVDITGGTATGCKRANGAFVTRLDVQSDDGALYVRQNGATRRILLNTGAVVAIENKEQSMLNHTAESHFGWYYFMTKEQISCPIAIPSAADDTVPACPVILGVAETLEAMTSSFGGPDCGNTNYP